MARTKCFLTIFTNKVDVLGTQFSASHCLMTLVPEGTMKYNYKQIRDENTAVRSYSSLLSQVKKKACLCIDFQILNIHSLPSR